MKTTLLLLSISWLGCRKPAVPAAGSGSSGSSGSSEAADGSGGSNHLSETGSAGTAPTHPTSSDSPAAKTLEAFEAAYGPIAAMDPSARDAALCSHIDSLRTKAIALRTAPGMAGSGQDAADTVASIMSQTQTACRSGNADSLPDDDGSIVGDAVAKLVALTPGAKPLDAFGSGAMPASDAVPGSNATGASAGSGNAQLRSALANIDRAVVPFIAKARSAASRDAACHGVESLRDLSAALHTAEAAAPNPECSTGCDSLIMALGDTVDAQCHGDSTATLDDIRHRFASLHDELGQLLKTCTVKGG